MPGGLSNGSVNELRFAILVLLICNLIVHIQKVIQGIIHLAGILVRRRLLLGEDDKEPAYCDEREQELLPAPQRRDGRIKVVAGVIVVGALKKVRMMILLLLARTTYDLEKSIFVLILLF
jgi:hypothetical protein